MEKTSVKKEQSKKKKIIAKSKPASKSGIYESEILAIIKEYNLHVIDDIFAFYTGCCRATFYNNGLDKLDSIKRAIDDNKIKTKQSLKIKWEKSDNSTLQLALFKLICSDAERKALSMNYTELSGEISGQHQIVINWGIEVRKDDTGEKTG